MTIACQASSATNMDFKIENLQENDVPCVAEIEKSCFSVPFKLEDILSYLKSPIWSFLVAKSTDGVVLGYASFTVIVDECQIVNIATSEKYRKMGVGTSLLKGVLSYAKKNRCKKVFLEVRESNMPAINLYKAFGFLAVGTSKNHYSKPTENALLMNLEP